LDHLASDLAGDQFVDTSPEGLAKVCTAAQAGVTVSVAPIGPLILSLLVGSSTTTSWTFSFSEHKLTSVRSCVVDPASAVVIVTGSHSNTTNSSAVTSASPLFWAVVIVNMTGAIASVGSAPALRFLSGTLPDGCQRDCVAAHRCVLGLQETTLFSASLTSSSRSNTSARPRLIFVFYCLVGDRAGSLYTVATAATRPASGLYDEDPLQPTVSVLVSPETSISSDWTGTSAALAASSHILILTMDSEGGTGGSSNTLVKLNTRLMRVSGVQNMASRSGAGAIQALVLNEIESLASIVAISPMSISLLVFSYFGIAAVEPNVLDSLGGALVTVTGEAFPFEMAADVFCVFPGGAKSIATVLSDSVLQCVATAAGIASSCGSSMFNIQVGSVESETLSISVTRPSSADLLRVVSSAGNEGYGSALQESVLTIYGSDFVASRWARVVMRSADGTRVVDLPEVKYVSPTEITCRQLSTATPTRPGTVLAYTHDGQVFGRATLPFILAGIANGLVVPPVAATEVRSASSVLLPTLRALLVDVNQNPLLNTAIDGQLVVATIGTVGYTVDSARSSSRQAAIGGIATFDRLYLLFPAEGDVLVSFSLFGVVASQTVRILPGTAYAIQLANSKSDRSAWFVSVTQPSTLRPALVTFIADISGNKITTHDELPESLECSYLYFTPSGGDAASPTAVPVPTSNRMQSPLEKLDATYVFGAITMQAPFGELLVVTFQHPTSNTTVRRLRVQINKQELCSRNQYQVTGSFRCVTCPERGICDGSATIVVPAGVWRPSLNSFSLYDCSPPLGVDSCGDGGVCVEGYRGPLCTVCAPGYGRTGDQCVVCASAVTNYVLISLIALGLLFLISLFVFNAVFAGREQSREDTADPADEELNPGPKDKKKKKAVLPIVLKLALTHVQMVSRVVSVSTLMPSYLNTFLRGQAQMSNFTPNLAVVGCSIAADFFSMFAIKMAMPIVLIVFFTIVMAVFAFHHLLSRQAQESEKLIIELLNRRRQGNRDAIMKEETEEAADPVKLEDDNSAPEMQSRKVSLRDAAKTVQIGAAATLSRRRTTTTDGAPKEATPADPADRPGTSDSSPTRAHRSAPRRSSQLLDVEGVPTVSLDVDSSPPTKKAPPSSVWSFIKRQNEAMMERAKQQIRQTQQETHNSNAAAVGGNGFVHSMPRGSNSSTDRGSSSSSSSAAAGIRSSTTSMDSEPQTEIEAARPSTAASAATVESLDPVTDFKDWIPLCAESIVPPESTTLPLDVPLAPNSAAADDIGNHTKPDGVPQNEDKATPVTAHPAAPAIDLALLQPLSKEAVTVADSTSPQRMMSRRKSSVAFVTHPDDPLEKSALKKPSLQANTLTRVPTANLLETKVSFNQTTVVPRVESSGSFGDRKESFNDSSATDFLFGDDEDHGMEEDAFEDMLEDGKVKLTSKLRLLLFIEFVGLWMESSAVSVVVVLFLTFPTVLDTATAMLVCSSYDYGGGVVERFLAVDHSISCTSTSYETYRVAGYGFLGAYGLGIPLCGIMLVKITGIVKSNDYARKLFFFTTGGFKDHLWFWDVVGLLRKGFLVVVTSLVASELAGLICAWAMAFFLVINVASTPWANPELSLLENLSLASTAATFSLVLLLPSFPQDSSPVVFPLISTVVVVLNAVALLAFARAVLKEFLITISDYVQKNPFLLRVSEILRVNTSIEKMSERTEALRHEVDTKKRLVHLIHKRICVLQTLAVKELRAAAKYEAVLARKDQGMADMRKRVDPIGTALEKNTFEVLRDTKGKAVADLPSDVTCVQVFRESAADDDEQGSQSGNVVCGDPSEDSLRLLGSFRAFGSIADEGGTDSVHSSFDASPDRPPHRLSRDKSFSVGSKNLHVLYPPGASPRRRSSVSSAQITSAFEKLILASQSLSLAVSASGGGSTDDEKAPNKEKRAPSKAEVQLMQAAGPDSAMYLRASSRTYHNPLEVLMGNMAHVEEELQLQEAYQQQFQAEIDFANAILMSIRRRGHRSLQSLASGGTPSRQNSQATLTRRFH
jgi:hypothetical protein